MNEVAYKSWRIYISSERKDEDHYINKDISQYIKHIILRLLGHGYQLVSYSLYISEYLKKQLLTGFAILDSHGYNINDNWHYEDDGTYIPVQHWINNNDGKYAVLLVHVCNPGGYAIRSNKSLVITPRTNFSLIDRLEKKNVKIELYVPGRGLVDTLNIGDEFNKISNKTFAQEIGSLERDLNRIMRIWEVL